jgi:hypothetical protein
MAITSLLNPENIVQQRPPIRGGLANFMMSNSEVSSPDEGEDYTSPNVNNVGLQANNTYINSLIQKLTTNIFERFEVQGDRFNNLNQRTDNKINTVFTELVTKITNIQNQFLKFGSDVEAKQNNVNLKLYQIEGNSNELNVEKDKLDKTISRLERKISSVENNVENQIKSTQQSQTAATPTTSVTPNVVTPTTATPTTSITPNTLSVVDKITEEVQSKNQIEIQNNVSTLTRETQGILTNTLQEFSEDYSEKIRGLEDSRPQKILSSFIKVYNNAISFANYFGDSDNIKVVSNNLSRLRGIFEESFEIAKMIRQTIVKIVGQLSNLPSASSSAGNMNLDVNVPRGALQQAAPDSVKNVASGGGRGRILGRVAVGAAGLAGGAALAYGATQAGKAEEYTESELERSRQRLDMMSQGSSIEQLSDSTSSFSNIVDRFGEAMGNMIDFIRKQSGGPASFFDEESGTVSATKDSSGDGGGGGGGGAYGPILDLIAKYEAGPGGWESMYPSKRLPGATKMTIAEVARRATGAVGMYQNLPRYLVARAKAVGLDPNKDLYNEENQRKIAVYLIEKGQAGVTPQMLKDNPDEAMIRLSKVWAAIPVPRDMQGDRRFVRKGESYYAGVGDNKAHITPEMMYKAMGASVNSPSSQTATKPIGSPQAATPQQKPTGTKVTPGPQSSAVATPASASMASAAPMETPSSTLVAGLSPLPSTVEPRRQENIKVDLVAFNIYPEASTNQSASMVIAQGDTNIIMAGGGGAQPSIASMPPSSGATNKIEPFASSNSSNPVASLPPRMYNLTG